MTRQSAVETILEACGLPRPSALTSTGTWPNKTYSATDEGDAEYILDRECRDILLPGWDMVNKYPRFVAYRANYYWTYTGSVTGTFQYGELIAQTGNASLEAYFLYHDSANKFIYIYVSEGTPSASGDLTGATSAASVTTESAITAVTSGKIVGDPLWLSAKESYGPQRPLGMSYNSTLGVNEFVDFQTDSLPPPTTRTWTESSVTVDVVANVEFTTLPEMLQRYIVRVAAVAFQRFKKNANPDDARNTQRMLAAKVDWMREYTAMRQSNYFQSREMFAFRGGRVPSIHLVNQ